MPAGNHNAATQLGVAALEQPGVPALLSELRQRINHEHEIVEACMNDAVTHAIRAGEAILAVRAILPYGTFGAWLAENVRPSRSTVSYYMRFARFQRIISGATTVQGAIKMLLDYPDASLRGRERSVDYDAIRARLDAGASENGLAKELGVGRMVIRRARDPEAAQQREKDRRARRNAERNALIAVERVAAARAAGTDVATVDGLLRRTMAALEELEQDGPSLRIREIAKISRKDVGRADRRFADLLTVHQNQVEHEDDE